MKNSKEYLIFQGIREKTYSRNKREDIFKKYDEYNEYDEYKIYYMEYI